MSNLIDTFNTLCKELELESNKPVLLIGNSANDFIENHLINRGEKFKPSNIDGMFLYENLDKDYIEKNNIDKRCLTNGVICMIENKDSSLIHEMRHAYQLNQNYSYMYLEKYKKLKEQYNQTYVYYPSEKDAYEYTINYLKKNLIYSNNPLVFISKLFKLIREQFDYRVLKIEYYMRNKKYKKNNKL